MGKTKTTPLWWKIFALEYLKNGQNGTEAYMKARPKTKRSTAEANSSKLLGNAKFQAFYQPMIAKTEESIGMSRKRWFKLLADVAEFNISEFMFPVGDDIQVVSDWDKNEKAHAIESIVAATTTGEDGQVFRRVSIKAASKIEALKVLGKALGYLEEKVDVTSGGQPIKFLGLPALGAKFNGSKS